MIDPVEIYLQPHQLHLGCFTTIYQKVTALNFYELGRGMSAVGRQCAARAENCYCKTQRELLFGIKNQSFKGFGFMLDGQLD